MSARLVSVRSYDEAVKLLSNSSSRKLGPNTYLTKRDSVSCEITYHGHTIAVLAGPGAQCTKTSYTNCGYETSTTKERLNACLPEPYRIYQKNFVWYLWNWQTQEEKGEWHNNMVFVDSQPV